MEYSRMECLTIYKELISGVRKRSPIYFWNDENLKIIIQYLFDEILQWNQSEILEKAKIEIFIKYKLRRPIRYRFKNNICSAINLAYDKNYKEWEFKKVPAGFWDNPNNVEKALIWVADKLDIPKEELQPKDLIQNNLIGLFNHIVINKLDVFKNKGMKNGRSHERIYKLGPQAAKRVNIPKEWSNEIFKNSDKVKLYIANETIFLINGNRNKKDTIKKICNNFKKINKELSQNEIAYLSYVTEIKIDDKYDEMKIILENEVYIIEKENLTVRKIEKS